MIKQQRIIEMLGVSSRFDVAQEARQRIDFLATYLRASLQSHYFVTPKAQQARTHGAEGGCNSVEVLAIWDFECPLFS